MLFTMRMRDVRKALSSLPSSNLSQRQPVDGMVQVNSFLVNHFISYSTADVDERLRKPFLE